MSTDELAIISEITLLPDGRVHVHGITRDVIALLHASGIAPEILAPLLRLSMGGGDGADRNTGHPAGDREARETPVDRA